MTHEEWNEKDREFIIRGWGSNAEPTVIAGGKGAKVFDTDGREYIDCSSGLFVNCVGYSHPGIVGAIKDQADKLIHTCMRQSHVPAIQLAERVAGICPGGLSKSYYCTGGTEAIEVAMKMAKRFTGKIEMVALKNAYHGLSLGALTLTSAAGYRSGIGPLMWGVLRIPNTYCYRCHLNRENCDLWCAREFERLFSDQAVSTSHTNSIAAIVVELVQGSGGIGVPEGWTNIVRKACDKHGVLMIVDEIQTGLGRTGKMLCCNHYGLTPDIITLAKGVGGGIPLGMAVTTDAIAAKLSTGTTPTSAGNAVACAAGMAFIDALEKEHLCENAVKMGAYFTDKLNELIPEKYVGEIRFKGLMGGIELVKDRKTKEPFDKKVMGKMKSLMLEKGVIISESGPLGNVLRIQPPLVVTTDEADLVTRSIASTISEVESEIG